MTIDKQLRVLREITAVHKQMQDADICQREAALLEAFLPPVMMPREPQDYFVGRYYELPVGHSAQVQGQGMGYYYLPVKFQQYYSMTELSEEEKQELKEIEAYWESISTRTKIEQEAAKTMSKLLPIINIDLGAINEIIIPLYRLAGTQLDYKKLIRLGLPGLEDEVRQKVADSSLKDGMLRALNVIKTIIRNYLQMLEQEPAEQSGPQRSIIQSSLQKLLVGPPDDFHSALQLIWLYVQAVGCYNYGRLDDVLGPLYCRDMEKGILTKETALDYILSFYRLVASRAAVTDGRFTIGGMGRENPEQADELAMLFMEATAINHQVLPQLTLRLYNGQNPALYQKALEVLKTGTTYPMLYNDDVNVPAVAKAFGISPAEAEQYLPYSCGEYIIDHASVGTPNGTLNVLKALETTLFNGQELMEGKPLGIRQKDFADYADFDEFYAAFRHQLSEYIDACAAFEALSYRVAGEESAFLLISMLYDDCIDRQHALLSGGVRYLCGSLECYGNTNTVDSLAAIKKLVYEEKRIKPDELLAALKNNFEGYEEIRQMLLNAPKYGNDDSYVDDMAVEFHNYICKEIIRCGEKAGLDRFLAVNINNSFNTTFGLITGASADGRPARTYMANANNPTGGMDKNGITAMLNSLVKMTPDIHAGLVQNMKFSQELFDKHLDQLKALLDTYFENGGTQSMISVVNQKDLEDAMVHPEKYPNLLVRVGGFSARFIELPREVQLEIVSRKMY